MKYEKIFISIATICYALYIFSYPPSFYNDDSLFLTNGIEYFSIIDFSPHFPGYPALIILGKILNFFLDDAKMSLFILSATCAIITPAMIYLLVENILNKKAALISFILTLSSPYLINLSLSMLSDSAGLFFFFLGLYFLQINRYKTSGFVFAISLFSRPSYIILFIVGFIYLLIFKKEAIKQMTIFFAIGLVLFLGFIIVNEGYLFIIEGKRFLNGHFNLWGTGQNSNLTWFSNIFSFANIGYLLLIACLYNYEKKINLYYYFFLFYLIWIILAQNPDNLRHIIPSIFIANIIISSYLKNHSLVFTFIFAIFNVFIISTYSEKISPIENILIDIKDKNKTIITNRGIEILRFHQNNPVIDKYYTHSSLYYTNQNKTIIIKTHKISNINYETFNGRFIGEQTLYLYEK